MTVGELLHRVSSRELSEWAEYAKLEPFGEERADLRAGIIASTMVNLKLKKGAKLTKPQDFMPKFDEEIAEPEATSVEEKSPRSTEDLLMIAEMWNVAFRGHDLRKKPN